MSTQEPTAHPPPGGGRRRTRRLVKLGLGLAVLVPLAILGWNTVQRIRDMADQAQ